MPARRGNANPRSRTTKFQLPVFILLLVTVVMPLVFLAARLGNFTSFGSREFSDVVTNTGMEDRKLSTLNKVESLFPKEVIDVIKSHTDDTGLLSLNLAGRKDLSSLWVLENAADRREQLDKSDTSEKDEQESSNMAELSVNEDRNVVNVDALGRADHKGEPLRMNLELIRNVSEGESTSMSIVRQQTRNQRKEMRAAERTHLNREAAARLGKGAVARKKEVDGSVLSKFSVWRRDNGEDNDSLVRLMQDQVIMARVYASLAHARNDENVQRELNTRIKEIQRVLGEIKADSGLPYSAAEKIKAMGQTLSKAHGRLYDCKSVSKKLRAMMQSSEEHARALNKQTTVLGQLIAKTLPKGLHCLPMLLTSEYSLLVEEERVLNGRMNLENSSLFHYALFSDNVLAAAVVVNSTVFNAKDPAKHVFHLVTDKLNYAAMKMWFIANPPGNASIDVQNIDDFKWLNASYCPVIHQLQTSAMKSYYFKADHSTNLADMSSNLKYRNPKYLSMLNHLRFYLPEVYPKLDKILFLDDDIVVQKDLTALWSIDLLGNVNGAVETCGESFHRFDKYLNFSHPLISATFDPNACGWAYGMNMFDLKEWKKKDITGIYHKWQNLNEQRDLWKLGTLPPGLITFYNLTYALDKRWHVLGLGYDPSVDEDDIRRAAVVHYNGIMKPWLELAVTKYKPYWAKYVNYNDYFLQECNING